MLAFNVEGFDSNAQVVRNYRLNCYNDETLELVRRGYTEEEIGMLWSGNLLRVLDEVQGVAAEIQAAG